MKFYLSLALVFFGIFFNLGDCSIKHNYYDLYDDDMGEIPEGAASLAFVFDITGSMYDDLVQVIRGASRILDTLLERREKPIYNYVLVPFHDPDIGPVTVTTDPDIFHQQLKDLYVQGGGDCPEMSVGAVKLALEVSLPNSYIYVFTDARSKDYHLLQDVLKLMQRKESQVVFVMTGDCGDQKHAGFQAYEHIASSSSGQVFHLKKTDVDEVLNFVQVSLLSRKVNLLAIDREDPDWKSIDLEIDSNLKEFTLSISGDNPLLTLHNPKGELVDGLNGLNELLTLNNVRIVNVKDPTPGQWTLRVKSDGRHSIRITGLSGLDFQHGYSLQPTTNLAETYHRPLKSAHSYLLVNATDLPEPGHFTKIQLIDLEGNILTESPLTIISGDTKLFNAYFYPPDKYFYLKVLGIDNHGYAFQRMTSVPISSQLPDIPEVITRPHLYGYYGKPAILKCYIQSLVPFVASWYKNNILIGIEYEFPQTTELIITIPEVGSISEGYYSCNASNVAGNASSIIFLDVKEPPPVISKPNNVSAIPGNVVALSCIVSSTVPYNVTWYRLTPDRAGYVRPRPVGDESRIILYNNDSLVIQQLKSTDEGWYRCVATNEGGYNRENLYLAVQAPPVAKIYPANPKFMSDDTVNITCIATGYPLPSVHWRWSGKHEKAVQEGRLYSEENSLIILKAHPDDEGHYECQAKNAAASDLVSTFLQYIEAPVLTLPEKQILIRNGDIARLRCVAEGIPSPNVTWYREDIEILPASYILVDVDGTLIINGVQETDAGKYTCKATNEAGSVNESLHLDVGSIPVMVSSPVDTNIDIGTNGSLPCLTNGFPQPTVTWQQKNGKSLEGNPRFTVTPSGSLFIQNITEEDGGIYVCIVENKFGRHALEAAVIVTGIVPPSLEHTSPQAAVKKGETILLRCSITQGNPKPYVQWLLNGRIISNEKNTEILEDGTLKITNANVHHHADYTCTATNVGGSATQVINLDIQEPPTFVGEVRNELEIVEGQDIILPCVADGNPKPYITWFKDNSPVKVDNIKYKLQHLSDLHIFIVTEKDSGTYTCEAVNVAGAVNQSVDLFVNVPPKVRDAADSYNVLADELVTLPCEVYAVPKADIYWYHNNGYLPSNATVLSNGNLLFKASILYAGDYVCQAINTAGKTSKKFSVTVSVPPTIEMIGPDRIVTIKNHSIAMKCPVSGYPLPTIHWKKNDLPIESYDNVDLQDEMSIKSVQIDDDGKYTCIATNSAGTASRNFTVIVHVPPTIDSGIQNSLTVVEGSDIMLYCNASGFPDPIIVWSKHEEAFYERKLHSFETKNSSLSILDVSVEDSGVYICNATNEAGNDSITIELNVIVPPRIDESQVEKYLQVVEDETAVLLCPATGIPLPEITWYWNDSIANTSSFSKMSQSQNGQILTINRIQEHQAGLYTCQVRNDAGLEELNILVEVLVAPKFSNPNHISHLNVAQGDALTINCSSMGNPQPKVTWRKDGYLIAAVQPSNIFIEKEVMIIRESQVSHSGRYSCVVENEAGHAVREYQVSVLVPPWLEENKFEKLEVIASHPAVLNCPARGIPPPAITWMKNDNFLRRTGIREMNGGRSLIITHTELSDNGLYSCTAENTAGEVKKITELVILVPPIIKDQQMTEIIKTMKDGTIFLNCEASGTPEPEFRWMKNDLTLSLLYRYPVPETEGGKLILTNVTESDGGRYTCTAVNRAGSSRKDFSVTIMVPPKMTEEKEETKEKLQVMLGSPIELICPVYGQPFPTIIWLKDDTPVNIADATLLEKGRMLHIYHSSSENKGNYTCVAQNEVGKIEKHYDIDVVVPPHIGVVVDKHKPNEGEEFHLYCPVQGSPPPDVVWLYNGQLLQILPNFGAHISENGSLLSIRKIEARHGGKYTCIASNLAGTADKGFQVDVSVPPSIVQSENSTRILSAILNHPITLMCPVKGIPTPSIQWLKNGRPIGAYADSNIMISADKRHLMIRHARLHDSAQYKCIAVNRAGRTEKEIDLRVLVAPRLLSHSTRGDQSPYDDEEHLQALENETITLKCEVNAVPQPTVLWFKDGNLLTPGKQHELQQNHQVIHINSIKNSDEGHYTCIVSNSAGTTEKSFIFDVLAIPKVSGSSNKMVEAQVHRPLSIVCNISGNPSPIITWYRNGDPISKSDPRFSFSFDKRELQFAHVMPEDNGDVTCLAENEIGKAEQHFRLDVQESPSIASTKPTVDAVQQDSTYLSCKTTGNPTPSIIWLKNGIILTEEDLRKEGLHLHNESQILYFKTVISGHRGKYTCIVSNSVGSAEKDFVLNVLVPPKIANSTISSTVIVGQPVTFNCSVASSPKAYIIWMKQGRPVDLSDPFIHILDDGMILKLLRSREIDTGEFLCIARNRVGEARRSFLLNVLAPPSIDRSNIITSQNALINETISLDCAVAGAPEPSIYWLHDNKFISFDGYSRYDSLSDGKKLRISPIQQSDAGKIKCVATNRIGRDEVEFNLDVFVPPKMNESKGNNFIQIVEGNAITIDCPLEFANPAPIITWQKDGRPLTPTTRSSLTSFSSDGHSLTLRRVHLNDDGVYKCIASNIAGHAEYDTRLEVIVPPMMIKTNGEKTNPRVIRQQPLTLNCKSDGVPQPTVTWLRNGTFLTPADYSEITVIHAGETLRIFQTTEDDAGLYTCVAENYGGSINRTFDVTVLVPPYMNPTPAKSTLSALVYTDVHLRCPAKGYPPPLINWYKDSRLIMGRPNVQISSNQFNLAIKNVTLQDSGSFICTAVNEAGSSEKETLLTILVPPAVKDVEIADIQPAVLQHSVRIICKVDGFPEPVVSWFLNGKLLTQNNTKTYYVQSHGHFLEIDALELSDSGTYTCHAENDAGVSEESFTLDILEPPTIANSSQIIDVIQGEAVNITCLVSGDPPPQISWLKDGYPAENTVDLEFGKNNTILLINATTEDHDAKYTCVATNQVGSVEQDFYLNVQIRPYFDKDEEEITTAVNRPLKLNCPSKGKPSPDITWFRDNQPIIETENVYMNAQYLQIHSSSIHHQGNYSCNARNAAGNANKFFKVVVTVPPHIENSDQMVYLSTAMNNSVEMSCVAEGMPYPNIMWKKDGLIIDRHTTAMYLRNNNENLNIEYPEMKDVGTYTCTATNSMGNTSKSYVLTVLEPPKIEKGDTRSIRVSTGEHVTLNCEVKGFPQPEVAWLKNYIPLDTTGVHHYISSTGSLHFYSVAADNSANYTCIAINEAGADNKTITLDILVPPTIAEGRTDVHVLVGQPAVLDCEVRGYPQPRVIWLKGTKVLQDEVGYTKHHTGSLHIHSSDPNDSAQYMCIAENEAGTAKVTRNFWVELPAVIKDEFVKEITVVQGEDLELLCPTEGYPVPKIIWEKDFKPINLEQPRYHIQSLGDLLIAMAQPEDGGVYRCIAENIAGKDSKTVNVIVHVPAVIQQDQAIPTVQGHQGGSVLLECEVSGFPPPEITWKHNGNILNTDSLPGHQPGDLLLRELKQEDSGQYVCIAVNDAGQDYWEVNVEVLTPPIITILPESQNISVGSQFSLNCEATGFPLPFIFWFHNGKKASGEQTSVGKSQYNKLHSEIDDAGIYTCVAQNSVGEKRVEVTVHVRVDGNWAAWSEWSPCSRSCGAGTRIRKRICNSPSPANGGKYCLGLGQQADYCNNDHCPVHGGWSAWSAWGECSASCSGGQQKSFRTCTNPVSNHGGRPCSGPSYRMNACNNHSCSGSPREVVANLIGEINNIDITLSKVEANITEEESRTKVSMVLHNIPNNIGQWMKLLVPLIPLHWVKAFEIGQAVNGYSLTKGYFNSDTDVSFPMGEVIHMTHVARGIDKQGRLLVDVVLSGDVPDIPEDAVIQFSPFTEDYVQIGPGSLYAKSSRTLLVNNYKLPYAWNHNITYDDSYGEMPYPVEKLYADDIVSYYNPETGKLAYSLYSTISLGTESSQCPEGFQITQTGLYCIDTNECEESNHCQHFCENILGSYYCLCPHGYALTSNRHTCEDIDECLTLNISCGSEKTCFNTKGSFRCVDTPCPLHYHRDPITRYCKLECDENDRYCPQHMKYSEILAFKMVALPRGVVAYQDLIRLTAYDQEGNHLPHSTFTITDNDSGVPFRIRLENGRGVLYTLRDLDPDEYRIKVQAVSYDDTYQIIQHTTKFMVFISISEHPY